MCGIAGYVGKGGSPDALRKMANAIRRRGPDDEGFFEQPGVGFGFRRLSIIDVAGGHQPLSNEDGTIWVMLNGEMYGFGALRDELVQHGHRFATRSDTEVIVHAYEQWGDACFEKLHGMFAIAIWDAPRERLVLARDRLGKKPLYWSVQSGTCWFASEVKALLATGAMTREIDLQSLALYFRTDAVPTPRTIFSGISKLEPATAMAWSHGKIEKTWSFWSCPQTMLTDISATDVVAGLRERVDAAVRERLVSDVPLGLFLSGGIDSAVIAESASRISTSPLKAFTIGFEDASHDERTVAKRVASQFGFDWYEDVLTTSEALGMIDEAVACFDEPLADAAALPQLMLSRFTRKQVTVALSGDGGDELLLGYQHIPAHVMVERLMGVPTWMREGMGRVLSAIPARDGYFSFGFKAQRLARGLSAPDMWSRDVAWRGAWTKDALSSLLRPEIRAQVQSDLAEQLLANRAMEAGRTASPWTQWTWGYLRTFLMDEVLVKVDRATMWYAIESRAPLLDTRVVEFLLRVPEAYKLGAWKEKRLFKELLRGRVPDDVLDRPKHGFGVPVSDWLRGPLLPKLRELASPARLDAQGLFETAGIQRCIEEHVQGRVDRRKELWAFWMFQLWYDAWGSQA